MHLPTSDFPLVIVTFGVLTPDSDLVSAGGAWITWRLTGPPCNADTIQGCFLPASVIAGLVSGLGVVRVQQHPLAICSQKP
jgi:hypothetical protein